MVNNCSIYFLKFTFVFFLLLPLDPTHPALAQTVENIADAVTHARFVGTDQASDGVVLMKIVQVLRTLMLNPEGSALTNESVCEVMLSCFRICFEPRLNELLRRTAEHALKDIVLLLFMRLPQFAEERNAAGLIRKLKMIAGSIEQTQKKRKSKTKVSSNKMAVNVPKIAVDDLRDDPTSPNLATLQVPKPSVLATTPATPLGNIVDMQGKMMQTPTSSTIVGETVDVSSEIPVVDNGIDVNIPKPEENEQTEEVQLLRQPSIENDADIEDDADSVKDTDTIEGKKEDFVNSMGVRFTPVAENGEFFHVVFLNNLLFYY